MMNKDEDEDAMEYHFNVTLPGSAADCVRCQRYAAVNQD